MPSQRKTTCPHLGLIHDGATHMNFPSLSNQCWHCKKPGSPNLVHQRDYCLTQAYGNCVINQASKRISMPAEIRAVPSGFSRITWIAIVLILLVGIVIFFLSRAIFPPANILVTGEDKVAASGISVSPTETLTSLTLTISTSTVTAAPTDNMPVTATLLPSETPVLIEPLNTYEVARFPSDASRNLLVHMVKQGETLEKLASRYDTTVQSIIAVNFGLTPPAWADYPIVIPVGAKDTTVFPSFKVYVVENYETISAEILANILAVDVKDLEFYNLCTGDCLFSKGDVLLIPHIP
jgi:LysM repeat protein